MATKHALPLVLALACSADVPDASLAPARGAHLVPDETLALGPLRLALLTSFQPPARTAEIRQDPYAGWQNWCEPTFYESQCNVDKDCEGKAHPSHRGAPFRCLTPWWAESPDLKICAPAGASKTERRWRYARLRELVSQLYFDEAQHCDPWTWEVEAKKGRAKRFHRRWPDGAGVHRQSWRCQREWRDAELLTSFLWVPYRRETTARPFKRHRLDPDEAANKKGYVRQASAYGWVVELKCEVEGRSVERCPRYRSGPMKGNKRVHIADVYPDPEAERHNPYYGDRWRWEYGLGPVGQNTAYGVQDWDPMAPPEVLCLEPAGFEGWLRDARTAVRKYRNGGVTCDGAAYRGRAVVPIIDPVTREVMGEREVEEPSFYDVHRVAAAGSWCPKKGKKAAQMKAEYTRQMRSWGIDPRSPVTEHMLGRPIPKDEQWERAKAVITHLDTVLPPPWKPPAPAPAP